jgi:hypothetical protein
LFALFKHADAVILFGMTFRLFVLLLFISLPVHAHEGHDPAVPQATVIPAAVEKTIVKITEDGTYRYISSNGIPNHKTGQFPNRGNPNSISAQSHKYRVPLNPQKTGRATEQNGVMGVALNGIPFEPGTAECYGQTRGQRPSGPPGQGCEWREEAIVNGEGQLGLDSSNAHVQPNGTYHYHGVPWGLIDHLDKSAVILHVGYAADGFEILYQNQPDDELWRSSYRLKSGIRPSGPGGRYDGTYTADYEYVSGAGDLDECNGITFSDGSYAYILTREFPFVPRCLMGRADQSFARRGPGGAGGGRRPPPRHRPPPF